METFLGKELTPLAIKAGRTLAERLFNGQTNVKMDYQQSQQSCSHIQPLEQSLSEEQAVAVWAKKTVRHNLSTFAGMYSAVTSLAKALFQNSSQG